MFSQKDFKNGFVIHNNQDTIRGYINLGNDKRNSEYCEFRRNLNEESQIFRPFEIISFRVESENKYYVSKQVNEGAENTQNYFLEYLLFGINNLYYLKNDDHPSYYIEKHGKIFELQNEIVTRQSPNGIQFEDYNNQFRGELIYLFNDAPTLVDQISTAKFTHSSLINVTKKYHQMMCDEYKCIDYTKSTKNGIYIAPFGGFIKSQLGLKASKGLIQDNSQLAGVNFIIKPYESFHRIYLSIAPSLSKQQYEGYLKNTLFDDRGDEHYILLNYSIIRIPLSFQYHFPLGKISPYVSIGFLNSFIIKPKYEARIRYSWMPYDEVPTSQPLDSDFRTYQKGIQVGSGLKYEIGTHSFLYADYIFEFRKPATNFNHFFDYHWTKSHAIMLGYAIRLN
ncbi:MAG: hypothetical protein ACJA08_002276 [Cyclobacteriaceae bacterium]